MKRLFVTAISLGALLLSGCAPARAAMVQNSAKREVPILMYHSILRDPARSGKYILSPDELERDIVWLLSNGYETVTCRELVQFVQGEATLPDRPVVLTFDDGYLNNMTYVLPLLQKYNCKAVISVVGAYTERFSDTPDPNPNYAHVTWTDAATLHASGLVELGNHTYDLHGQSGRKGCTRKPGETERAYADMLSLDVGKLQDALSRHTGVAPVTFAYPYGAVDEASEPILTSLGLCVTLTCRERISTVCQGDMGSLLQLGRFNRASGISTEAFMKRVFGAAS